MLYYRQPNQGGPQSTFIANGRNMVHPAASDGHYLTRVWKTTYRRADRAAQNPMKLTWHIEPDDIAKVQAFFAQHQDTPFVKKRVATNLRDDKPPVTKPMFWERMVGCLLTSQQRSGPNTAVSRFLRTQPLPLGYESCVRQKNLDTFTRTVLTKFGGLRRTTTIGKELSANLSYLENGGWYPVLSHLHEIILHPDPETERRAADFIDEKLKGFGPKQSRNLLQGLGLSRYETPIDSRITKWLNEFGFPVKLTANALGDHNYYAFVSEGFQRLCEACGIMPCVLDAAIFSSFDGDQWTEENAVW